MYSYILVLVYLEQIHTRIPVCTPVHTRTLINSANHTPELLASKSSMQSLLSTKSIRGMLRPSRAYSACSYDGVRGFADDDDDVAKDDCTNDTDESHKH